MKKRALTFIAAVLITGSLGTSAFAAASDDYLLLVNEYHPVSASYGPLDSSNLSNYVPATRSDIYLRQEAVKAYIDMNSDMVNSGISNLSALSGHRTYDYQRMLFDSDLNFYIGLGYSYQDAYNRTKMSVAVPGGSEHQTGMAIDVTTDGSISQSFENTSAGSWLKYNSYRYGFILRYPEDKQDITKITYEPWHFRYVGLPHSQIMYENNLALEEYVDLLRDKREIVSTAEDGNIYRVYYRESSNTDGIKNVANVSSDNSGGYIVTTKVSSSDFGQGYIDGYDDGTFRADNGITRAEAATIFTKAFGSDFDGSKSYPSTFLDVSSGAWYANAIGYMQKSGIIEGYEDGTFRPNDMIKRSEFVSIIAKMKKLSPEGKPSFIDISGHWAEKEIGSVAAKGWVKGYEDGTFRPEKNMTRAEVVTVVNRMMNEVPDKSYIDENKYKLRGYRDLTDYHWAYYDIIQAANLSLGKN